MKNIYVFIIFLTLISCKKDFLDRYPLDQPSSGTFWTSATNAEMWVNYLYNNLPNGLSVEREGWSDNAYCGSSLTGEIASGIFQTNSAIVENQWDYTAIRGCLELLENIELIPDINQGKKDELTGQARFILAFKYFEMMTLFRDIPLVKNPLTVEESDIPKSLHSEVLAYVLEQINKAIDELPVTWPASQTGRITRGAALALKARVLLFNERWAEAASAAKQLMDMNVYELHPNFDELFIRAFNNKTKEVILAYQYAKTVKEYSMVHEIDIIANGGFAIVLASADLANSFECIDGLPINESPIYDPNHPLKNRDPRFYKTLILPYDTFAGFYFDPLTSANLYSVTYLHFRKYIGDKVKGETMTYVNWILFRYAEVLLTYAEATNEATGPDNSVYNALNSIRVRAGMPVVDRGKYDTKEKLRELIRNERRVELALEGGLRYFDIIRWRIAENVLNKVVKSYEIPGLLPVRTLNTWVFDPNKHYVWPIPQSAIEKAKNLEQNAEWK